MSLMLEAGKMQQTTLAPEKRTRIGPFETVMGRGFSPP
jgi:hypothetical protein